MRLLLEDQVSNAGRLTAGQVYDPDLDPQITGPSIEYRESMRDAVDQFLRQRSVQNAGGAPTLLSTLAAQGVYAQGQQTTVYLDPTNGDDTRDGTTEAGAVRTWARVWQLLPVGPAYLGNQTMSGVFLVRGKAGTATYELPPSDVVWGAGSGILLQGIEDTVVASGVAGAATSPLQLELAVATGLDAYRHFTVEFTSGAAAGFRRTVRDNSTTVCFFTAGLERVTTGTTVAQATPAPGDSYRILRPAWINTLPTVNTPASVQATLALPGVRVDAINVALRSATASTTLFAPYGSMWFGVDLRENLFLQIDAAQLAAGADDAITFARVNAIYEAIGRTRVIGEWHGWGLSFSGSAFSPFVAGIHVPSINAQNFSGMFYGFVTSGTLMLGNAVLLGGSAGTLRVATGGHVLLVVKNLGSSFTWAQALFKIKSTSSSGAVIVFEDAILEAPFSSQVNNEAIDIEQSVNMTATSGLVSNRGVLRFATRMRVNYTGTGGYIFITGSGNGAGERPVTLYNPSRDGAVVAWSCAGASLALCGLGAVSNLRVLDGTFTNGFVNNGGRFEIRSITATNTITCTGLLITQTDGDMVFDGSTTMTRSAAGNATDINGGTLKQRSGSLRLDSTAGDSLVCRGGTSASLTGGASTTLTGTGGYGCNARFGGRVFFDSAPTAVTGTVADMTVGTGGGEDFANATLAASESGVARAANGSVIARAA